MFRVLYRYICMISTCACLVAVPAHSNPDNVALTVDILDNDGALVETVVMTLEDIKALPTAQFDTTTIWTSGPQVFTGIWLETLLSSLDVDSGQIELRALNDYHITLPVSEAAQDGAMLAYWRNYETMSARENGPFWLVYDYDSDPKYRSETYYSRSIWQLDHITVSR